MVYAEGYAQVAKNLATGEADMVIIPNGRITPLLASKLPASNNWHQHLNFPSFFAIPKGAAHKANAMRIATSRQRWPSCCQVTRKPQRWVAWPTRNG